MTVDEKENILKAVLSTYENIGAEKQSYALGFINGLAQSKKLQREIC